jgi:hypothetical protein
MFRKELEGESGGDKVVPSVTPDMAKAMLQDYTAGKPMEQIIQTQTEMFSKELSKSAKTLKEMSIA